MGKCRTLWKCCWSCPLQIFLCQGRNSSCPESNGSSNCRRHADDADATWNVRIDGCGSDQSIHDEPRHDAVWLTTRYAGNAAVRLTTRYAGHATEWPTARYAGHATVWPTARYARHATEWPTARHARHATEWPTARHATEWPTARHATVWPTARYARHATVWPTARNARYATVWPTARYEHAKPGKHTRSVNDARSAWLIDESDDGSKLTDAYVRTANLVDESNDGAKLNAFAAANAARDANARTAWLIDEPDDGANSYAAANAARDANARTTWLIDEPNDGAKLNAYVVVDAARDANARTACLVDGPDNGSKLSNANAAGPNARSAAYLSQLTIAVRANVAITTTDRNATRLRQPIAVGPTNVYEACNALSPACLNE